MIELDNQTCFLSWVTIAPQACAQTIYSTWLVLKQGQVSATITFSRQNSCRHARGGFKPAGCSVVNYHQSRTQTMPQPFLPSPPRAENTLISSAWAKLSWSTLLTVPKITNLNFRYNTQPAASAIAAWCKYSIKIHLA